jgi:hypothetical protein
MPLHTAGGASGGNLGLQDRRGILVQVVRWLKLKPGHPLTVGPGKPSRPSARGQARSSGRALHLDSWRLPRSPVGGPTVTG